MPENKVHITITQVIDCPVSFDLTDYAQKVCQEKSLTNGELDITFISSDQMISLNTTYKDHNYDTDILTFNLSEDDNILEGDIYISVAQAQQNAVDFGQSFDDEVRLLIIHGILHLMGYDDIHPADKTEMDNEQRRLLEILR